MSKKAWELFDMYVTDTNYRAKRAGRKYVYPARLLGAIVNWWIVLEASTIYEGFLHAELQAAKRELARLPSFMLDAVEAYSDCHVSEGMRAAARKKNNYNHRPFEKRRAVRDLTRGPAAALLRSLGGPSEVRGGGDGAGAISGSGSENNAGTDHSGALDAGPSSDRLGQAEALLTRAYVQLVTTIEGIARGTPPPDDRGHAP